jgi:tRNA threonylcarbamoyladenosine biosynthesis protein TsaE
MPQTATEWVLELASEAETRAFGERLASLLRPGDVIALIGPLGAGKTFLVKAIAGALGAPEDAVNSPTFLLIQEYAGRFPVRHCDVYRLRTPAEFPDLGLDELFAADGVAIIEWADRVQGDLPQERLEIRLAATGLNSRRAALVGYGPRGRDLASAAARGTEA